MNKRDRSHHDHPTTARTAQLDATKVQTDNLVSGDFLDHIRKEVNMIERLSDLAYRIRKR